ncbi:sugar phosphate nucleotidyltransferase [Oscillospiraceae bacterium PP1C4]
MKAVIMAGGQGSRLRPLTCSIPKPMARLCGRPIVEYILELLAENGVTESVLTLQYLPELVVSHFADGFAGMKLSFCEEDIPLGTAGSVKNALGTVSEPVLIISGDALCDFPLRQAMEEHQKSGAAVTIVTTKVGDPREYGLVIVNREGRITGFIEKPSYAQATSELANTGIYILSPEAVNMIPERQKFDFASELFPKLLEAGMLLQNCTLDGYWCDIGDLNAYRLAQGDMLAGRVRCNLKGDRDDLGNLYFGRKPTGKYELIAPVYIGESVHIGDNAVISEGSVLDDGCTVAAGATVSESILLPYCVIGERAGVLSSVVCAGAAIKSKASLLDGAAVGEDAVIGSRAIVRGGVRITSGAKVIDGAVVSDHITTRGCAASAFDDDGLCGEIGIELTPELAVRVGCAVGSIANGRTIGVATSEMRCSKVLGSALIAGIRSTGASVLDFGCVFEAMFSFAMGYNALTLGVYLCAGEYNSIKLVCDAGLPATRKTEREIEIALARGEFARAAKDGFGDCVDMSGIGVMYLTELLRLSPEGLSGMSAQVVSSNKTAQRLLTDVLTKLSCDTAGGITLHLSENGTALSMNDAKTEISAHRAVAAYCMAMFEQEHDVAVENDFPRTLDLFAEQCGRRVYRYLLCPADGSDEQGRKLAAKQQCTRDGLMLAVLLLDYMKRKSLTLDALDRLLPAFATQERAVPIDLPPAQLLDGLSDERAGEGIVVRENNGVILLRPRKNGNAIRVFAEAASWEIAQELCSDFTKRIGSLLDKKHQNG